MSILFWDKKFLGRGINRGNTITTLFEMIQIFTRNFFDDLSHKNVKMQEKNLFSTSKKIRSRFKTSNRNKENKKKLLHFLTIFL